MLDANLWARGLHRRSTRSLRPLLLAALAAPLSVARAQFEHAEIYGASIAGARFGHSVALDGDLLIVGAPESAQAFAYRFEQGAWVQDGPTWSDDAGSRFGWRVALQGSLAIVGAPYDTVAGVARAGSVSVYRRVGVGQWIPLPTLSAPDAPTVDAFFGQALELSSQGVLAVGEPGFQANDGRAHVYEFASGQLALHTTLFPTITPAAARFGFTVAIDGDLIAVSAPWDEAAPSFTPDAGTVRTYRRNGGGAWVAANTLIDGSTSYQFGTRLELRGDLLVVGPAATEASKVQTVFQWNGAAWVKVHTDNGLAFGSNPELAPVPLLRDGELLRTQPRTATVPPTTAHGSVLRYWISSGGATTLKYDFYCMDQLAESFGAAAAVSGQRLVVGAPTYAGTAGAQQGRVHTFDLSVPAWNWTFHGTGILDTVGHVPRITGAGSLHVGNMAGFALDSKFGGRPAFLVAGFSMLELPLFSGLLYPQPEVILPFVTDFAGDVNYKFAWPSGLPASAPIIAQYFVYIAGHAVAPPDGVVATNASVGTPP
ncbi:MAG: hypothetical protein EPO68_04885 [Planctomycetota bacterium]|nr:MAG: hypothetical protein EPO68_04885 [Planctomycetota bacterium]